MALEIVNRSGAPSLNLSPAGNGRVAPTPLSAQAPAPVPVAAVDEPAACLEIRDGDLDVQSIMRRIRESIEAKRASGLLRDEPWLSQRLDIANLPGSARRNADRLALLQMAGRLELEGDPIRSHRPLLGPVINLVKRVSRFWIRKYTDQIFIRQAHYNAELLDILSDLVRENQRMEKRLSVLEKRLPADVDAATQPGGEAADGHVYGVKNGTSH